MIKEELESAETTGNEKIATFGNVHFYVMFNTHLLDPDELEEILKEIRSEYASFAKIRRRERG